MKLYQNILIEAEVPKNQLPKLPKNYTWTKKSFQVKHRVKKYYYTYVPTDKKTKVFIVDKKKKIYFKRQRIYYSKIVSIKKQFWVATKKVVKVEPVKKVREVKHKKYVWLKMEEVISFISDKYEDISIEEMPYFSYIEKYTRFNYDYEFFPKSIYDIVFLYFVFRILPLSPKNKSRSDKYILKASSFHLRKPMLVKKIIYEIPLLIKVLSQRLAQVKSQFVELVCWSGAKKKELEQGKLEALSERRKIEKSSKKKILKKPKGIFIKIKGAKQTETVEPY